MSTEAPGRALALQILRRMGEAGQPPEQGIRFVNVGNESYLRVIEEEYLRLLLGEARGSSFKLVQGYFGAGKTHFLYCVRDVAWRQGFLTALVGLSSAECPFDRRLAVYQAVAARLSLPPAAEGEEPVRGLPAVLRALVEERAAQLGKDALAGWVRDSYERANVEWHPFRRAAAAFLRAAAAETDPDPALEAWLLGEPVPPSALRDHGVFDAPAESNAFGMLRSLLQTVVHLGHPGTVLLFDEMDRTLSLGRRRTRELGDNLRQLIDLCSLSELPATLFLYAVPPEFLTQVVPEYPALQQRLQAPVPLSRQSPKAPLIDLERMDLDPEPFLVELGERLLAVEEAAYGEPPAEADRENLRRMAAAVVENLLDVSHRRFFVKAFIGHLDSRRGDPKGRLLLGAARLKEILRHTSEALATDEADDEEFRDA
ncbi:MAG: DUF2791 family P-loop domain-containing protein [Deltaproteobacteria bacterium]|nr:DUF2791 family P-loop domain-containing protein [Deltaproteobacteria bacterium]